MCGKKNERVLPLECEFLFSGFFQLHCTWFILLRIAHHQRGFPSDSYTQAPIKVRMDAIRITLTFIDNIFRVYQQFYGS